MRKKQLTVDEEEPDEPKKVKDLFKNIGEVAKTHRKIIKDLIKNVDAGSDTSRKIIKATCEQVNRTHSRLELAYFLMLFKEESNPLYLWKAYTHARKNHFNLPPDILRYFDLAARAVLKIESKRGNRGVSKLKDALGLEDRDFTEYHKNEKRLKYYFLVQREIEKYGVSKTEAFANVAMNYLKKDDPNCGGAGTVKDHYYRVYKIMKKPFGRKKKQQ